MLYADCLNLALMLSVIMLNVVMLNVVMLSVIMLSVVMLNVVAHSLPLSHSRHKTIFIDATTFAQIAKPLPSD